MQSGRDAFLPSTCGKIFESAFVKSLMHQKYIIEAYFSEFFTFTRADSLCLRDFDN